MVDTRMARTEPLKYLLSVIAVAAAVLGLAPFAARINSTTVALALLLTILFLATAFGSRYALVASLIAVLCFNFFFLPPLYTFTIADPQNWVSFGAFVITAIVAGQLSTYARRRAEESERRRVEIEKLYEELQNAFEQASEAEAVRRSEKLKSALLDAITHDLRTPLTSIKASATSLIESKKSKFLGIEGEVEFLEIINEESDRLNQFIEGLVGLARIEANELDVRKEWTTVAELFETSIERSRKRLDSYHVVIDLEKDLPSIYVDASAVSEALYLLLDNAAKYSAPHSVIKLTARQVTGARMNIVIEDQGRGIPPSERQKIFEKFVRISESDVPSTADGMGLGLAIVKGIVESQGGAITIEDAAEGFSTRFVIDLPIDEKDEL